MFDGAGGLVAATVRVGGAGRAKARWWAEARAASGRPGIVTELLRDDSVVCDRPEAEAALGWARSLAGWSEGAPAVWVFDPHVNRLRAGGVPPGIAPS